MKVDLTRGEHMHRATDNIVCPHCGHVHSDSWEVEPDSDDEFECHECEQLFSYERYTEVTYNTSKPKAKP